MLFRHGAAVCYVLNLFIVPGSNIIELEILLDAVHHCGGVVPRRLKLQGIKGFDAAQCVVPQTTLDSAFSAALIQGVHKYGQRNIFFIVLKIFLLTSEHQKASKEYRFQEKTDDKIDKRKQLAFFVRPTFVVLFCVNAITRKGFHRDIFFRFARRSERNAAAGKSNARGDGVTKYMTPLRSAKQCFMNSKWLMRSPHVQGRAHSPNRSFFC